MARAGTAALRAGRRRQAPGWPRNPARSRRTIAGGRRGAGRFCVPAAKLRNAASAETPRSQTRGRERAVKQQVLTPLPGAAGRPAPGLRGRKHLPLPDRSDPGRPSLPREHAPPSEKSYSRQPQETAVEAGAGQGGGMPCYPCPVAADVYHMLQRHGDPTSSFYLSCTTCEHQHTQLVRLRACFQHRRDS